MIVKQIHAQEKLGPIRGIGRIGLENLEADAALEIFTGVLSAIIGIMTIGAALWFLITLITASYQYMSAGGDNQKIKESQQKIQNAIIGLFLTVAAVFILSLFGTLIGVPFLNIGELFNRIVNQTF